MTCHSTLPESQTFVGLFKPQSLFPLTLYKQSELFDHLILPYQFRKQLASGGFEQLQEESLIYYKQNVRMTIEQEQELPGMIQKRLKQVSNVEAPIYYLEGDNESNFEPIKSTLKRTEEGDFDKIDFTSEESIEVKKRIKKPLSVLPSIEIIEPLLPNIQIVSGSANVGSSKKMAEEENSLDRLEREDQPPTLPTLSPTLLTPSPTILTPSPAQLFSNQKRSLTPGSSPESSPESTFPPSKRFKISPLPTLIRFRTTPLDEEQKRIIAKILADRKSGGFF